jgi:hypothetical protein
VRTPRPLTVVAVAILMSAPALLNFAEDQTSLVAVLVWVLGAIVLAGIGLSVVAWVWDRYSRPRGQAGTGG